MNKKPADAHESSLIDHDWQEIQQSAERPARRFLSMLSLVLMLAASRGDMAGKRLFSNGITISSESRSHISRGNEYTKAGMDELGLLEYDQAQRLTDDLHMKQHRGGQLIRTGAVLFLLAFGRFGVSRCVGERAFSV